MGSTALCSFQAFRKSHLGAFGRVGRTPSKRATCFLCAVSALVAFWELSTVVIQRIVLERIVPPTALRRTKEYYQNLFASKAEYTTKERIVPLWGETFHDKTEEAKHGRKIMKKTGRTL